MCRMFRLLRADEIDCRVGTQSPKGVSLLLYKDARCDMAILDETVGAFNWQRSHTRENANCIVSIYDEKKGVWVSKEDTGTESKTEAEKGLASDSFKRACFNWGIGRELYTAPFIWVSEVERSTNDKVVDKFSVKEIGYENDVISYLVITNRKGKIVYTYGKPTAAKPVQAAPAKVETAVPAEEVVVQKAPINANISAAPATKDAEFTVNRRAIWSDEAKRYGQDDKGMIEMYKTLVAKGILPNIPLKSMTDDQFLYMIGAIETNFDPVA